MSITRKTFHLLAVAVSAAALGFVPVAGQAKKLNKRTIKVERVMPKMHPFYGSGSYVPMAGNAATIRVYGANGKYEDLADPTGQTEQPWRLEAVCPFGQTLFTSRVDVQGERAYGYKIEDHLGKGALVIRGHSPKTVVTHHDIRDLDIGVDPVRVCNAELAKRALNTGKSRTSIQNRGFVVRVDDALKATAKAQCAPLWFNTPESAYAWSLNKKRKYNTLTAKTTAPVYVACLPGKLDGKKPGPKPKPHVPEIKARMMPVTTLFGGKQTTNLYSHKCPIQARLQAEVLSPRSQTIRYRYIGDGWKGPIKEKQLKQGVTTLPVYNKSFDGLRNRGGKLLNTNPAKPDGKGWVAVEILRTGKNIVSEREPYRIYCHDRPARQPVGAKPKTVIFGPISQAGQSGQAPARVQTIDKIKTKTCADQGDDSLCPPSRP